MTTSPPSSSQLALPPRLEGGTVVGRYVIDGWLRDGGMASLYRGHHAKTGAKVAIKVQLGRGAEELVSSARFEREGQVMGRLSGVPHVVQVHDVDALPDGRRYLVMEWLGGDNLEELIDDLRNADRSMEVARACRIMKDVALALVAVHRAGVVHRDLKPSNIMIDHGRADDDVVRLVDFGISADLDVAEGSADLTAAGVVLGTPGYVAPEQALGLPAHPSFDVFAFGVVSFEMLTGHGPPPEGLVAERLPAIASLRSGVPDELATLVSECLQRDPSRRPPDANALVERLDAVLLGLRGAGPLQAEPSVARGETAEAGSGEPARGQRRWGLAVAAGLVAAVLVAAVAVLVARCGEPEQGGSEEGSAVAVEAEGPAVATSVTSSPAEDVVSSTSGLEPGPGSSTGLATGSGVASTGEGAGSSSTEGTVVVPGSSDGDATTGPNEPSSDSVAVACERARRRALGASRRREWEAVLRSTSDQNCWAAADQRRDRRALRVEALAELGRFERCVAEGTGSTDPRVARRTKLCRTRIGKEPE